jgi:hypothetical protein
LWNKTLACLATICSRYYTFFYLTKNLASEITVKKLPQNICTFFSLQTSLIKFPGVDCLTEAASAHPSQKQLDRLTKVRENTKRALSCTHPSQKQLDRLTKVRENTKRALSCTHPSQKQLDRLTKVREYPKMALPCTHPSQNQLDRLTKIRKYTKRALSSTHPSQKQLGRFTKVREYTARTSLTCAYLCQK